MFKTEKRLAKHVIEKRKMIFKGRLQEVFGNTLKVRLSEYRTVNEGITAKCLQCSHVWETTPKRLTSRKQGCPECIKPIKAEKTTETKRTRTYKKLVQVLVEKFSDKIKCTTTLKDYQTEGDKVKLSCNVCAYSWEQTPKVLINYNLRFGCKRCATKAASENQLIPIERYFEAIHIIHAGNIKPVVRPKENVAARKKIRFECTECSNIWEARIKMVASGTGCKICAIKRNIKSPRRRNYIVSLNGGDHILCGYEPQAVKWIVEHTKITREEITPETRTFQYIYNNKTSTYIPDLGIVGTKKIIEVKSFATAGLSNTNSKFASFSNLKAKANAVEKEGYIFILMLMDNIGNRIKLPEKWKSMNRVEVLNSLQ